VHAGESGEPGPGGSPLDEGLKTIDSMLKEEYTKREEAGHGSAE
jgi:hypothetical protein